MYHKQALLIAICTTLLSPLASQAAFDPAIVPADSQWVVYLNFNTLRESELGRELADLIPAAAMAQGDNPVRPNIPKILETVGSITAFGRDFPKTPQSVNGALILQGTQELRTIVEGFLIQFSVTHPEVVTEVTDLPFEAYAIRGDDQTQLVVALPAEPIVVVSKSRDEMLKALEVFRQKAPSMRTAKSPLSALIPQTGAYYVIAASNVPSGTMFPANAPQSRILQMAQSASIAVGEEGDRVLAQIQLDASSDDLAVKLERIVNGVIAMASLAETSDERLTEFIESVHSTRDGRSIRLQMSYPTARILEMVEGINNPPPDAPPPPTVADPFSPPGTELDRWVADVNPGDAGAGPASFMTRSIPNVRLETGATIVLSSRRDDGENVRFDYVDVISTQVAGQPVRLEAESMQLNNYRVERVAHASGGAVTFYNGYPTDARARWDGPPGIYTLQVRYVDETDGASIFAVSLLAPETPAADDN